MTTEQTNAPADTSQASTDDQLDAEDLALAESFAFHSGKPQQTADSTPPADQSAPVQQEDTAADVFARELEGAPPAGDAGGEGGMADPLGEPTSNTSDPAAATARAALGNMSDADLDALRKRLGLDTVDSLKQGLDKLAGTVGGMNRVMQTLQSIQRTADTATPEGAAAKSAARKLERSMLKELDDAGYGDVADSLLPVLERVAATAAQPVAADNSEIEALRSQVLKQEARELNRAQPTWKHDIAARDEQGQPMVTAEGRIKKLAPEFVSWINQKPEQYRDAFMGGFDADFVVAGLAEFKQFRASSAPASSPAPAVVPANAATTGRTAASSKQARLAAAVVPVGSPAVPGGSPQPDEDADLEAGFNAIRGAA